MRRNPLYRFLIVGLVFSLPVALAASATVKVDCTQGGKIKNALKNPAAELTIEISGFCQEQVIIERDNVTLIGSDPANDGITGPVLDDPSVQRAMVRVFGGRNVRFENLTLTGSEGRGLEATDSAVVEVVNSRVVGNDVRGIQANEGAVVIVEDSEISDNGGIDLVTFFGGLIICDRCTVVDDGGSLVAAVSGGRISFGDSTLSTTGSFALFSQENGSVFGRDTDVSAAFVPLYALQGSQIRWTGGEVGGSIWADGASQIFLSGVTQTANLAENFAGQDSFFEIDGGSFVGDTVLTGFSNGTAESSPSFDAIICERGGNLFCDGSETKTSSSGCGLCP